ncbi:MAG: hypothetical protein ABSE84_27225, partial [Isosphaeraceae bacterium]
LELRRLALHPGAPRDRRFEYDVLARLHGGVWECPSLPFPVNDLSAYVAISNGLVSIKHAEGSNGNTILRAAGSLALGQAATCPFDLRLDLVQLEMDKRLQERTPAQFAELWDVFKPRGLVDAYIHLARQRENDPVSVGATVLCRDVAAVYRHFPYPVEHMGGSLKLENQRLSVDLHGLIGERPALLKGTIDNPGPDALVRLDIQADSVPIDAAFLAALPKDVRKVVDQFHPAGSVKGKVRILRWPMVGPRAKPEGHLVIDADLDLNPRCEITWAGLPYPIRNLTGRLELHPDLWEFKNMRGGNGQAIINPGILIRIEIPVRTKNTGQHIRKLKPIKNTPKRTRNVGRPLNADRSARSSMALRTNPTRASLRPILYANSFKVMFQKDYRDPYGPSRTEQDT